MARTGKVYLSKNIKIDRDYKNVLNYNEASMISLLTSNDNLVYSGTNLSFIRENKEIVVEASYGTCLQANYLAFQNPDYSNKWFFAFIDKVEYVSEKASKVLYTVDLFTTWFSYWSSKACFVVREHVTDDTVGLHTLPEEVATGDYVVNNINKNTALNATKVIIGTTVDYYWDINTGDFVLGGNNGGGIYGGIRSGYKYFYFDTTTTSKLEATIQGYANNSRSEAIGMVFLAPTVLVNKQDPTILDDGAVKDDISPVVMAWDTYGDSDITKLTTLNGYSPVNNKLKTYPYMYLYLTNNNGGNAIYKYELFQNPTGSPQNICNFAIKGVICPGMSGVIYPINYNGITGDNYSEGIPLPKFPICGYQTDVYTNWLTQQSVNRSISVPKDIIMGAISSGVIGAGLGGVPGAVIGALGGAIVNGGRSIFNNLVENKNHEFIPPQANGNVNTGDISYSTGNTTITAYAMSIKQEYARIIDNYFKLKGYKVNAVKVPNMSHRQNFNYVEIASGEILCFSNNYNNIMIPATDLESINNMFRNGITIWNNHTNMGDFSVSNNITA